MSVPNQFEGGSNLYLGNASTINDGGQVFSYRNVPPASTEIPVTILPPLPPRQDMNTMNSHQHFGMVNQVPYGGMGSYGIGTYGGYGMGSYGGYGMGNYVGYGGYGSGYGTGAMGMGGMYGGYNRFGMGAPMYGGDLETRFIQMAEEGSRPAFDSIQSLVNAVGSIAMMLENTFFALTSSFRAILGVAENVGRLRSLFSQFWSTFAVITKLNWIARKLLVMLGIRTESEFRAWSEAVAATQAGAACPSSPRTSSWPVLLFFGVIAAAPYLVFKMLNSLTQNINEKLTDPTTWQNPLRAIASYSFQARSPQELSFSANQVLNVAPQSLQPHLWTSGWIMASADKKTAGLVPVNYIKIILSKESEQNVTTETPTTEPDLSNLSNDTMESLDSKSEYKSYEQES